LNNEAGISRNVFAHELRHEARVEIISAARADTGDDGDGLSLIEGSLRPCWRSEEKPHQNE